MKFLPIERIQVVLFKPGMPSVILYCSLTLRLLHILSGYFHLSQDNIQFLQKEKCFLRPFYERLTDTKRILLLLHQKNIACHEFKYSGIYVKSFLTIFVKSRISSWDFCTADFETFFVALVTFAITMPFWLSML